MRNSSIDFFHFFLKHSPGNPANICLQFRPPIPGIRLQSFYSQLLISVDVTLKKFPGLSSRDFSTTCPDAILPKVHTGVLTSKSTKVYSIVSEEIGLQKLFGQKLLQEFIQKFLRCFFSYSSSHFHMDSFKKSTTVSYCNYFRDYSKTLLQQFLNRFDQLFVMRIVHIFFLECVQNLTQR